MRKQLLDFLNNLKVESKDIILKASPKKNAGHRISNYKGVIINGKNWEVRYFFLKQKNYLCQVANETQGGKIFDICQIQNRCFGANINFNASKSFIISCLFEKSLISVKNESDV